MELEDMTQDMDVAIYVIYGLTIEVLIRRMVIRLLTALMGGYATVVTTESAETQEILNTG